MRDVPSRDTLPPTGTAAPGPWRVARRTVLRGGAVTGVAAALAGCGLLGDGVPGLSGRDRLDEADTRDLTEALHAEEALLLAYRASVQRHPGLRDRLDAVRGDHEEHRRVLLTLLADLDPSGPWAADLQAPGAAGPTPATTGPAPASVPTDPSPGGSAPVPSGSAPVPGDPIDALAALRALEQDAASARAEQAVRTDARQAPLFGVLAASEASHAAVLAA